MERTYIVNILFYVLCVYVISAYYDDAYREDLLYIHLFNEESNTVPEKGVASISSR